MITNYSIREQKVLLSVMFMCYLMTLQGPIPVHDIGLSQS